MFNSTPEKTNAKRIGLFLLLIPFIVLTWPPFYNMAQPELAGIPFFYWFQFLWIFITALLTAVAYALKA